MSSSKRADELQRALKTLPKYVAAGVRSTHEVLAYLRRRGIPPQHAARIVSDYRIRGRLDDRACACLWADHWARQGYAWSAIQLKLSAKGLGEDAIAEAASRLGPASTDEARARLLIAQRTQGGMDRRQRVRLARTLASRGFDPELVDQVLNPPNAEP